MYALTRGSRSPARNAPLSLSVLYTYTRFFYQEVYVHVHGESRLLYLPLGNALLETVPSYFALFFARPPFMYGFPAGQGQVHYTRGPLSLTRFHGINRVAPVYGRVYHLRADAILAMQLTHIHSFKHRDLQDADEGAGVRGLILRLTAVTGSSPTV